SRARGVSLGTLPRRIREPLRQEIGAGCFLVLVLRLEAADDGLDVPQRLGLVGAVLRDKLKVLQAAEEPIRNESVPLAAAVLELARNVLVGWHQMRHVCRERDVKVEHFRDREYRLLSHRPTSTSPEWQSPRPARSPSARQTRSPSPASATPAGSPARHAAR